VVRNVKNLRPISLCADLAHVQDALWIARNRTFLENYAGNSQVGGVADILSLVLCLILHAELRLFQGLPCHATRASWTLKLRLRLTVLFWGQETRCGRGRYYRD
jgi:hypothetical protein